MNAFPKLRASSDELLHLDLIRFVASVGIVIDHSLQFFFVPVDRPWVTSTTSGLDLFVDLFFVISGFVIAYFYHDKIQSGHGYKQFLQRRIGRLVPLHWLTLAIFIIVWSTFEMLGFAGRHTPSFRPDCIAATALLVHSFVHCGNGTFFNFVSWSISAEMVMYVIYPFFAFVGSQGRSLLFILGAITVVALLLFQLDASPERSWIGIAPVFRALPSFIIGTAFYYGRAIVVLLPKPTIVLALAVSCLSAMMVLRAPHFLSLALVYLVVASAVASDLRNLGSSFVRRYAPLGQLTYSIYMWHSLFILIFINAIGDKLLHGGMALMVTMTATCFVSLSMTAYFSFFYFETPVRRWINGLKFTPARVGGPNTVA